MFFNKSVEKETSKILLKENGRLKRENEKLRDEIDSVVELKEQYEKLISDIKILQKQYKKKYSEFIEVENEYKKELEVLHNINKQDANNVINQD